MRRGFTILELLVASLLLGMLTTILTMVFNQSSISWRTGMAMVADLDDVRDNIAELREEADNAFAWHGHVHRHVSLWNDQGGLNERACDAHNTALDDDRWHANMLDQKESEISGKTLFWSTAMNVFNVGQGANGGSAKTYTVNVMSAGPDREFDTWDDVWSFPDDFE